MEGEITVTVTVRGLKNPDAAAMPVVNMIKRSMHMVEGIHGQFGAEIAVEAPGRSEHLILAGYEWQRVRDSNSRGSDPNCASDAAP
jgi:hypothetical protein